MKNRTDRDKTEKKKREEKEFKNVKVNVKLVHVHSSWQFKEEKNE